MQDFIMGARLGEKGFLSMVKLARDNTQFVRLCEVIAEVVPVLLTEIRCVLEEVWAGVEAALIGIVSPKYRENQPYVRPDDAGDRARALLRPIPLQRSRRGHRINVIFRVAV